jgi:hypothetical protein
MCMQVYHKWIEIGINYACKSIAIAIAMFITRVLSRYSHTRIHV